MLSAQEHPLSPNPSGGKSTPASDPLLVMAKDDARKTLEILEHVCSTPETRKTRTEVLRTALEDVTW
jgi:hypothetical protein